LNWYNQLPNWLTSGTWGKANLTAVLENHVTNLVKHFGDRCYAWDVVNEALSDSGTGNLADNSTWRSDIWYNTIGPEYVAIAFRAAEAAVKANKLKVKLYYNDYNIESAGNKSKAAQALVKSLKDAGIQIDGVGLQSHFIVGETPSRAAQTANMQAFAALGVDTALTELDVRTTTPPTLAAQQQQVLDYESSVGACADVDTCVGVTVWDFDDSYSWIPSTFPGQGYGDLFFQPGGYNTPLVRKAAYDGCIDVSPHPDSEIVSMLIIATGPHQLSSKYCQTNQSGSPSKCPGNWRARKFFPYDLRRVMFLQEKHVGYMSIVD